MISALGGGRGSPKRDYSTCKLCVLGVSAAYRVWVFLENNPEVASLALAIGSMGGWLGCEASS